MRLRFKELKGGNKSIYLDIYVDGKRRYEFLKLFLVPEISPEMRERNEYTLKAANAIRSQRILDITNQKVTVEMSDQAKQPLIEWLDEYEKAGTAKGHLSLTNHINNVKGTLLRYCPKIRLGEVDKEFIKGYIHYLENTNTRKTKKPLAKSTILNYCVFIKAAINYAVEMGVLTNNPLEAYDWSSIKGEQRKKEYLTIEEVHKLKDTDCRHKGVKRAFLFACFCGLRYSDLKALQWGDVVEENGKRHIEVRQQKTGRVVYIPLSRQAESFMPQERGQTEEHLFNLPSDNACNAVLEKWCETAGVSKHVTFHVSRHTFATMALTAGADIYTTSQLMGHSDVETTQVYGKIVDKKKVDAVFMIDKLFG